jgi:hypothetical protein
MTRAAVLIVVVLTAVLNQACFGQKLVDPSTVAPEYREAAEKRRAEQIKLIGCTHKAIGRRSCPEIGLHTFSAALMRSELDEAFAHPRRRHPLAIASEDGIALK